MKNSTSFKSCKWFIPYFAGCGDNSSGNGNASNNSREAETCASDINLGILKENVEAFLKKESNFKRPPKPDVIYAKLTKNLLSNHEWCGHRLEDHDYKSKRDTMSKNIKYTHIYNN